MLSIYMLTLVEKYVDLIYIFLIHFYDAVKLVCFGGDFVYYGLGSGERATCKYHSINLRLQYLSIGGFQLSHCPN